MQYRVLKHITLALGRKIESALHAETGKKVRVAFEYSPDLKKAPGAITVIQCGLQGRGGNVEREYERDEKGERRHDFRYEGGIRSFVEHLNKNRERLHDQPEHGPRGPDQAALGA